MNKNFKGGLLLFMLVGPLLFFTLFHLFGTNHYGIKKYYPIEVKLDGDTLYHTIPDFVLVNQNGEKITKESYSNQIFVVSFFKTTCPTICPKVAKHISYLQESFKNHADVNFMSHALDSESDDVNVLKEYAKLNNVNSERWNLVTGELDQLIKLAKEGYRIIDKNDVIFEHSNKLVLVDKNYVIRGYFDGTKEKEVENLLSNIRILRYEQGE